MSREYVSTEFDCRQISVIVHRSAGDKLAVFHSSCLFGADSYSGQRERQSVRQGFQSKICELVSGKLSKCLCIQSGIPLNLRTVVTSWSYCSRGKWRIDHLNDHSHRFSQTYILKTFHVAYTIFSSRQRIGSHTRSVL